MHIIRILITGCLLLLIGAMQQKGVESVAPNKVKAVVVIEHRPYSIPSAYTEIGAGFFIDDNLIVTAAHVVGNHSHIKIKGATSQKLYDAEVIASDAFSDIALLKIVDIQDFATTNSYQILSFGSSKDVTIGTSVWSIGHPWDLEWTVTEGIVSAESRRVDNNINFLIQTDTEIYQGSSGGPLLNLDGEVIGINDKIIAQTGGSFGLAIPSDLVVKVLYNLKNKQPVEWAVMGVAVTLTDNNKNIAVDQVIKGSAADRAGIKSNDIIANITTSHTGFMGRELHDVDALMDEMAVVIPGETITLTVIRNDATIFIDILPDTKTSEEMAIIGYAIN